MNTRQFLLPLFAAIFAFGGCFATNTEPQKYAELREGSAGRFQILISGDEWMGVFTAEGFGGNRHSLYAWTTLQGSGPDYIDPVFHYNAPMRYSNHRGKITVDRARRTVVIDLQRVVSGDGEPELLEPSFANGTYPIKKITEGSFEIPE